MKLSGLNAIITGANQGLGLEIARHYVLAGASIAICARDTAKLDAATKELRTRAATGQKIFALACDVSDEAAVNQFTAAAIAALGSIQILVNNAGVYGPKGPSESVDWTEWKRAIEINLYGVVLPTRAIVPHLKQQGRGKIINLSGGGATQPLPMISAYAASKASVVRLTETLRRGTPATPHRRQRCRPRRTQHSPPGRSPQRRPGRCRRILLPKSAEAARHGWHFSRTRRESVRLPCFRRK